MLQATETALSLAVREEIGAVMSDRRPGYVAGADGAVRFANAAGILSAGAETFLDIAGRPLPFDPAVCRHVARFAAHAEAGRRSTELVRYRTGMKADLVQITLVALGTVGGERLVLVILAAPLRGPQAIDFAASLRLLREPGLLLAAFDERGDVCAAVGDYAILQHTQEEVEDFVAATDAAPVRRAVVGTGERVRVTIVTVGATDLRILAVERDDGASDGAAAVPAEPDPTVVGGAATDRPAEDEPSADAASVEDAATAVLAALAPAHPIEPPAPPYPGFDASDTERAIDLVAEAGQGGGAATIVDKADSPDPGTVEADGTAQPDAASDGLSEPTPSPTVGEVPSDTDEVEEAAISEAPDTVASVAKDAPEAGSPDAETPRFAFTAAPRPHRILWQTDTAGHLSFLSADFAAALGADVAPRLGESWAEAAARLGADAVDYVAAAFARQAQFAGLVLEWPVADHALSVPVELTGLPVFGPARRFEGFRGFGLVRTGDAKAMREPVAPPDENEREPDGDTGPDADAAARPIDAPDGDTGPAASAPSASAASDEIEAPAPDAAAAVADRDTTDGGAPAADVSIEPQQTLIALAEPSEEPEASATVAAPQAASDDLSRGETDETAAVERTIAVDSSAGLQATPPDAVPEAGEQAAPSAPAAPRPSGRPSLTIVEIETQPDRAAAAAPSAASPPPDAPPAPAAPENTAESGRVVPVPAKADARVVTLASALRRPTDGRLTPPERIAFRQIAQALGARLEGDEPSRKARPAPAADDAASATGGADETVTPVLTAATEGAPEAPPTPDGRAGEASLGEHGQDAAPIAMDVVWADWVAAQDAATLKAVPETRPQAAEALEAAPTLEPAVVIAGAQADRAMPAGRAEAEPPSARLPDADTPPRIDDRVATPSPTTAEAVTSAPPAANASALAPAVLALPAAEAEAKPRLGLADPVVVSDAAERILARLPIGAAVVKDETLLFVNPAFLRLLGYASAEELQQAGGLGALFAGPHAGRNFETGADAKPVPAVTKDGSVVPVTARIVVIPWGAGSALLLTLDRAQRALESETISGRAALDALGAARERADELEAVIDTATDGVLMLDGDGRVVSANRASEALFGQDRSEMTGRPFLALLAPESHRSAQDYLDGLARNGVASVLNDGREVIGQVRPDGLIPLFMTIGRISSGRSSRFCAVLRDITQWKKSEEELTAARRRAEEASVHKSEFLAKISHEIRTPLNAVIGFSEVMLDERFGPIGNERYKDYLRDIRTSGAHIMSLINDLLDLSKVEAGKMDLKFEAVALADLLGECVAMMQPQANRERIIIRASLPVSVPAVVADPRSIRQIVLNLLSNAVKFTPAGGQVIVSTALEDTGEVVVRVRDTGYGMTEKEIQTALEPFRQLHTARTRGGGTGLGLPLTKALVEANRAAFRIDSTVNQGTLVSVTFPVTRVLAG